MFGYPVMFYLWFTTCCYVVIVRCVCVCVCVFVSSCNGACCSFVIQCVSFDLLNGLRLFYFIVHVSLRMDHTYAMGDHT